jgi:hypothetical protein
LLIVEALVPERVGTSAAGATGVRTKGAA